jgi:hypothetical protein
MKFAPPKFRTNLVSCHPAPPFPAQGHEQSFEGRNAPSIQPYQNAQTVPGFMDQGKIVTRPGANQPDRKHMDIRVLRQNRRNFADRKKT